MSIAPMRWGFGWELGPFELIDAIGIKDVLAAAQGTHAWLAAFRRSSPACSKAGSRVSARAWSSRRQPTCRSCGRPRTGSRVIKKNAGASLVDLGDGVIAVEFHSKMNAIGGDTIQMLQAGVKEAPGAARRWSSATTRRTSPPART
jgi:3-hydroxyacyl-CoA dehydrogenase